MADVETFVTLQPDQIGVEGRRHHLGDFGLADACLSLQQKRTLELQREIDGRRQPAIGDVEVSREERLELVDRG
jgi:hypothetical protein